MPDLPTARIIERKDVTHDLWIIKLEPEIPFTFKPGQYITIGAEGVERPYSIVSAPHEPSIELFIELVPLPQGQLTPILHKMSTGATVSMRPKAKGVFTLDEGYRKHLMVATVTGVVPYISILRSYLHQGTSGHRFYVLMGASYQDEFTYDKELQGWATTHPETITFVPTISRPDEEQNRGWQGAKGRVNTLVEEYIERFGLSSEDTLAYACGHPGMIEDMKERLLPRGWKVKEERFWKE